MTGDNSIAHLFWSSGGSSSRRALIELSTGPELVPWNRYRKVGFADVFRRLGAPFRNNYRQPGSNSKLSKESFKLPGGRLSNPTRRRPTEIEPENPTRRFRKPPHVPVQFLVKSPHRQEISNSLISLKRFSAARCMLIRANLYHGIRAPTAKPISAMSERRLSVFCPLFPDLIPERSLIPGL